MILVDLIVALWLCGSWKAYVSLISRDHDQFDLLCMKEYRIVSPWRIL